MNCQFCNKEFNLQENLPLRLLCNHIVCKNCANYMKFNCISVICCTCESKLQAENSSSYKPLPDYREIEEFSIDESMIALIKDKTSCQCTIHNTPASQFEKSTLKFFCEKHSLVQKDQTQNFKELRKEIFADLYGTLLENKQNILFPKEEMRDAHKNFFQNLQKLKKNHLKIQTEIEKVENFTNEYRKEMEILHQIECFKHYHIGLDEMSIEDKVKYLKIRRDCEFMNAASFKTDLKSIISDVKCLNEKLKIIENKIE